jgi:hypothetical protein
VLSLYRVCRQAPLVILVSRKVTKLYRIRIQLATRLLQMAKEAQPLIRDMREYLKWTPLAAYMALSAPMSCPGSYGGFNLSHRDRPARANIEMLSDRQELTGEADHRGFNRPTVYRATNWIGNADNQDRNP